MIDYTAYLRGIIADISVVCPEFSHIRTDSIIVTFSRSKTNKHTGILAFLAPLRFQNGVTVTTKNGKLYEIPTIVYEGQVKLYMIGFVYPRFIDLPLLEKARTIVHEMYHISERFDGDIRRFPGRTFAHSGRKANFDKEAERIAKEWLQKTKTDTSVLAMDSQTLKENFSKVIGTRFPRPKIKRLS